MVTNALDGGILQIIKASRGLHTAATAVGAAYLYLFDWALTIVSLYLIVRILAPMEPRNLFPGVGAALRDFVRTRRVFCFAGLYWPYHTPAASPTILSGDPHAAHWNEMASAIHKLCIGVDATIAQAGQGINSRAAVVFEPPRSAKGRAYCLHYRRLGKSAFVAVVDNRRRGFSGRNTRSQNNFKQLSESVGTLINVRDSLK
jgi:hypothetical protein